MKFGAHIENSEGQHTVTLRSGDNAHSIAIPPKPTGFGSKANGAELLFLALATCYCNDIYREAMKKGIKVERVAVEVEGDFGAEGEPAENIAYWAKVTAHASEQQIRELMWQTDKVAEIQNTLRVQNPVTLSHIEVKAV